MIYVKDKKLIIEIATKSDPLAELATIKDALHTVLACVDPSILAGNPDYFYQLEAYSGLLSSLDFTMDQMQAITVAMGKNKELGNCLSLPAA